MKNLFKTLLITLSFLFISCNEVDENTPSKETQLISINIPKGFYNNDLSKSSIASGYIYLTDNKGELIAERELTNNTTTDISLDYNLDYTYDATFLKSIQYQNIDNEMYKIYYLSTFIDVSPYELKFKEDEKIYASNEKAEILIKNINGHISDLLSSNTYSASIDTNSGEFEINIKEIPDNIYFSFKHENEEKRKYLLKENIQGNISESVEYVNLPFAQDITTTKYPKNDKLRVSINGATAANPNNFFALLSRTNSNVELNSINHNVPTDVFKKYKTVTNLEIGNKSFKVDEISNSINTSFSIPDLSFQVINNSLNNFEVTSSSIFDYYSVNVTYFNELEKYDIIWNFYIKSQSMVKLTTLSEITESIKFDDIKLNQSDLAIKSVKIIKIDGINSYKDFISSIIDAKSSEKKSIVKKESLFKSSF